MARQLTLLIIEDEEPILVGLKEEFSAQGFAVDFSWDGEQGLQKALQNDYDVLLLDIMLPSIDGFQICREVRKYKPKQPIVLMSARDTTGDIVSGFQDGADDYVPKPFSIAELVARVQALLRRARVHSDDTVLRLSAKVTIDIPNLTGTRESASCKINLKFTRREVELLQYLQLHRERPVPREELLREVWGYRSVEHVETRTVDIHIAKIRRKIESDSNKPTILRTVWGEGYTLAGVTL